MLHSLARSVACFLSVLHIIALSLIGGIAETSPPIDLAHEGVCVLQEPF